MEKNKENNKEAVVVQKEAVAAKPAVKEDAELIKTVNATEFYMLTRPAVEGEWKPRVAVIKADDPRAADGPDVMLLPK